MPDPIPFPRPTNMKDLKTLYGITDLEINECKRLLFAVSHLPHAGWREALGYHFACQARVPKMSRSGCEQLWRLAYARGYGDAIFEHEKRCEAEQALKLLQDRNVQQDLFNVGELG